MSRPVGPGALIDVVAPAGPFDVDAFNAGVALLRTWGFRVRHRDDVTAKARYLAGPDERRLAELDAAIRAPDSDVVWCARGGYGTTRLLDGLDVDAIRRAGKVLVGFSDITALHALWRAAGVPSIHGSMIARLATEPADVALRLLGLVSTGHAPALSGHGVVAGTARGVLSGGNLALLAALCGTRYQPALQGALVFLEDVGERPYRLDRMLVQCRQAGLFDGVAGLVLGEFAGCAEPDGSLQGADFVAEFARGLGVPVLGGVAAGHGAVNHALPFGVTAVLDADAGSLSFPEPLFAAPENA